MIALCNQVLRSVFPNFYATKSGIKYQTVIIEFVIIVAVLHSICSTLSGENSELGFGPEHELAGPGGISKPQGVTGLTIFVNMLEQLGIG